MAENEDPNIISRIEKERAHREKKFLNPDADYTKFTVGGETKEVPASAASINCQKCGKKIDSSNETPLCDECERVHD